MTQKRSHQASLKAKKEAWKMQRTDGQWAVGKARGIDSLGPQDDAPPWEKVVCVR